MVHTHLTAVEHLRGSAELLEAVDALGRVDRLPQGCLVTLVHGFLQADLHPVYGGRHLVSSLSFSVSFSPKPEPLCQTKGGF